MTNRDDEKKWHLPDALRVDLDTEESNALLAAADEQQKEWRKAFATPYLNTNPATRERARALIIIDEYADRRLDTLQDGQRDELAEAYATIGRFDLAAEISSNEGRRRELLAAWEAVWRKDGEWCEHGMRSSHAALDIYSIKHGATVSLMRCDVCGRMNAIPSPEHLVQARAERAKNIERFSGLTPLEAKKAMQEAGLTPRGIV